MSPEWIAATGSSARLAGLADALRNEDLVVLLRRLNTYKGFNNLAESAKRLDTDPERLIAIMERDAGAPGRILAADYRAEFRRRLRLIGWTASPPDGGGLRAAGPGRQRMIRALVLALLLAAGPAAAQGRVPCGPSDGLAAKLAEGWGEAPVAHGLQNNGSLLQVYAAADGATFTVVATSPAGLSCIIATGKSWEMLPVEPDGEAS